MEKKEIEHIPILKKEVVEGLRVGGDKKFIDCTFGLGGHTKEILKRLGEKGRVLAFEYDNELFELMKKKFSREKRLILVNDSFSNLLSVVREKKFFPVSGILADLGIGSFQIEKKKGFSFWRDEELDMRYNPEKQKEKAKDILNTRDEKELREIFKKYGPIKVAKDLARKIIEKRPIETTFQLKEVLANFQNKEKKIVRKVFLALRLATNRELENLKDFLEQTILVLEKGGRLAVITYHSLEERIVKHFLRQKRKFLKMLSKKPILPSFSEVQKNKKARSAKLFLAEKK